MGKTISRDHGPIHPYFGASVRWWRLERGLSVRGLTGEAGMSPSLVSAYERHLTNPKYDKACKLAKTLGVPVSYLWDHDPPPDRPPSGLR